MLKRLAAILICLIIIFISVPSFSFADSTTDSWTQVTTNEQLADAFRYYCKSRDLTIEGSAADVVTSFTTQTFNNICNVVGIDITALQAHIKYASDGNGGIKWLFDSTGITAYNRIFSQFLQDNEISVGDSVNNKNIYQGYELNKNNSKALIYIVDSYVFDADNDSHILQHGGTYLYDSYNIGSYVGGTVTFPVNNSTKNVRKTNSTSTYYGGLCTNIDTSAITIEPNENFPNCYGNGCCCIVLDATNNYLWLCTYLVYNSINNTTRYKMTTLGYLGNKSENNNNLTSANVYIYAPTINNNTYEGDTIINPDGSTDDDNNKPSGGTPPNWDVGGGDGTLTDPNGNTWNINFPDFQLPDLNIDWSINGLGNKFPFSIPFDLVSLVTVLSAPAEAPRFQGTVNFGFTTWNYDINLQPFDNVARACRIAELLLLVFGLIMITRSIIKG